MSNRITVIFGAGAALDLGGPSTGKLTDLAHAMEVKYLSSGNLSTADVSIP